MNNSIPLTVIVPVKNEEKNLTHCLDRLHEFDQVMVIDSGSIDRTPDIVKEFGFEYHLFNWDKKFPKKRNWTLRNLSIKNEWVLFLDADEYITPEFKEELKIKIQDKSFNGYWIIFQNYFMGKLLKHGDQFKKLPLFRIGKGEYERIEEDFWSHLDMEVHEHPVIEGNVGIFKSPIIHNDFNGLEHYIAKHNAYSSWEAHRFLKLKESDFPNLNKRQKLKYRLIKLGLMPLAYFFGSFFLKAGFLDGKAGYYLAKYKSQYFFQIQTKIKEIENR